MRFNRIFLFILILVALPLPLYAACHSIEATPQDVTMPDTTSFLDSLTFLGDSTTAHMQQRSPLAPAQIWAAKNRYLNLDSRIASAKIIAPDTGAEETIGTVAARLRPAYLVVTLGVDYGVYYYREKPAEFRRYYEKLLDAVHEASPDTVIILQSVFPVGVQSTVITNDMIANANSIIREIATARNLVFADQVPVLADEQGFLRPEYCYSDDGIHLTSAAYDAILQHLTQMENEIRGTR